MNKYQEALNDLENICGDSLYNAGIPKYVKEIYTEEYENIKQFIKNQEKYKWHDLRKNPDDFPKEDCLVLIYANLYDEEQLYHYNGFKVDYYSNSGGFCEDCKIIAWKEIERFENIERE